MADGDMARSSSDWAIGFERGLRIHFPTQISGAKAEYFLPSPVAGLALRCGRPERADALSVGRQLLTGAWLLNDVRHVARGHSNWRRGSDGQRETVPVTSRAWSLRVGCRPAANCWRASRFWRRDRQSSTSCAQEAARYLNSRSRDSAQGA